MLTNTKYDNTIRWREGERMHHLFEQACDDPERTNSGNDPAVITDDGEISFRELDERANRAARYLRRRGVKSGDRVGILVNKSVYTYVALLAVLKNNAAFVPLDPGFPKDRTAFICTDAEVETIVTLSIYEDCVSHIDATRILLDAEADEIAKEDASRLSPEEAGDDTDQLAYIIYTSGSTGNPKGVACEHASACNFIAVAAETYGIRSDDRMYQGMTIAFDFSFEELWVPLAAGAALVPGQPDANLLGADLHSYLVERKVTAMACVPTLLATIEDDLPELRFLLVSGEACPRDLVNRWYRPDRIFINAYGPTEAAVTATLTELHPDKAVTIGGPLATYTIVILEEGKEKEVPDGDTGEICVAGICLARGYVNLEDRTKESFIPDFLNIPNNPSGRIYRTGDLGRINEDEEIEFLGRIDTQVKVRGYRIELSEIESVFMEAPEIALAVVDTHEPAPGAVDLVAYYTLKDGFEEIDKEALVALLRSRLPAYMMPSYVEHLAEIPMLPSQKADRKKLPPPAGPRFVVQSKEMVAPRTETEATVAEALAEILSMAAVSVEDHFFEDMGANSLLMAQLSSALRERIPQANLSMREIYLNPTVTKLAKVIDSTANTASDAPPAPIEPRRPYHKASNFAYYGCGFLQLTTYILALVIGAYVFVYSYLWVIEPIDWFGIYLRTLVVAVALFLLVLFLPVALKWMLIGRWTEQEFPVWSLRYFRFWLVKLVVESSPVEALGGPLLYAFYLRLLGARIGKNVLILSDSFPVCTDLVEIGDDTYLAEDTQFTTYRAESGYIRTGSVTLGRNVFVGEGSVLDIDTAMGDGSQLGHASSLSCGQRVPAGKRYHGSPGQETDTDFNKGTPMRCTMLRMMVYFFSRPLFAVLVLLPFTVWLLHTIYVWYFGAYNQLGELRDALFPPTQTLLINIVWIVLALFFIGIPINIVSRAYTARLCNLFLKPGKTYVLYGIHYFLFMTIKSLTNSKTYNILFGDSRYAVPYLSFMGYDLSELKQTGSNFGTNQKHDVSFLCKFSRGAVASDGLAMMNAVMTNTSFRLEHVHIRENTFVGNLVHYPSDGRAGENCLLASRVMIPIDGPVRENTGLLGSPAFEIPRTVQRDRYEGSDDPAYLEQGLKRKTRRNLITIFCVLLVEALYTCIEALVVYYTVWYYLEYGMVSFIVSPILFGLFTLAYFILHAQWSLTGKRMEPSSLSIYEPYFWKVEHYWKRNEEKLLEGFGGTPYKNVISRLLGIKVGAKVFDDGSIVTEKTMCEIGDYCTLNESTSIQCHTLEEGFFKSDYVKIGNGCTVGVNAYIQYGVTMEDNSLLETNSYLMKGELLQENTVWQGNPAAPP